MTFVRSHDSSAVEPWMGCRHHRLQLWTQMGSCVLCLRVTNAASRQGYFREWWSPSEKEAGVEGTYFAVLSIIVILWQDEWPMRSSLQVRSQSPWCFIIWSWESPFRWDMGKVRCSCGKVRRCVWIGSNAHAQTSSEQEGLFNLEKINLKLVDML